MIFITGDTHADFTRFSLTNFPEQKEMSKNDYLIICGDFGGVWCDTKSERYWLDWLSSKSFTLLFVDGNHENFDRLAEWEVIDFHGGKAHKIRDNIYHLMRGYVFDLEGKKFFTFGGAKSHDIDDGILNIEDYSSVRELVNDYNKRTKKGQMLRINHASWWEEELPNEEEMEFALKTLEQNNYEVDFIITHCAPKNIAAMIGYKESDKLTTFFDGIADKVSFKKWFFGHYHSNKNVMSKYILLYEQIVQISGENINDNDEEQKCTNSGTYICQYCNTEFRWGYKTFDKSEVRCTLRYSSFKERKVLTCHCPHCHTQLDLTEEDGIPKELLL